jgi:hypothetical protein
MTIHVHKLITARQLCKITQADVFKHRLRPATENRFNIFYNLDLRQKIDAIAMADNWPEPRQFRPGHDITIALATILAHGHFAGVS